MFRRLSPIALIASTGLASLAAIAFPSGAGPSIGIAPMARLEGTATAAAIPGDPTALALATRRGAIEVLHGSRLVTLDDVSKGLGGGGRVLSLAFPPDYASTGLFYVFAVDAKGRLAIWQRHVPSGSARAERRGRRVLAITPAAPVTAGQIAFGPDGLLWIGTPDPKGTNAQDGTSLLGKLLRIDPTPSRDGAPFTISRDQSGITPRTRPEVFARGLRDPHAFSFSSASGALALVDRDELNRVDASTARGANFEWACSSAHPCGGSFIRPSVLVGDPVGAVAAPGALGSGTLVATASDLLLVAPGPDGTPADFRRLRGLDGARVLVADADGDPFLIDRRGVISRVERRSAERSPLVARIRVSPLHAAAGDAVTLDGRSSATAGTPLAYAWDTDGDGDPESTRPTFTITLRGRRRMVSLIVDDGQHSSRRVVALPVGPPTPLDLTPPAITLRARSLDRSAIRVSLRSSEAARWRVWVSVSGAKAAKLGIAARRPRVELAASTFSARAGSHALVLTLPQRLRRLHGVRVVVAARAVDEAGNPARARTPLALG